MEDLNQLLDLLPPQVRAFFYGAFAVVGGVGLFMLALKGFVLSQLGLPQPTDPQWKTRMFSACKFIDTLGLNTATFASLLEISRKEKEIRKLHAECEAIVNDERKPGRVQIGPCPVQLDDGHCRQQLTASAASHRVRCSACGARWVRG